MKNKRINQHLYKALQYAPLDLLDTIKTQPIDKLEKHDYITRQETPRLLKDRWNPILALGTFAAVFMVVVSAWFLQYSSVDSIVYLDVNPSIEIATDKNERVVKLQAITQDSQALVEDIDYKGKDLYLVTEEVLNVMMAEGHIDALHRFLLISVMNDNLEKGRIQTANLNAVVHDYLEVHYIRPVILRQSITKSNIIEEYSNKYNISIGRMTLIGNLITLNPDFKVEELVVLSIEALVSISSQTQLDIKSILDVDYELDGLYRDNENEVNKKMPAGDELIGREKAIEIARGLTGGGKVVELELDEDDGWYEYEIKIVRNGTEYDVEIDAHTGKVLEFEVDNDGEFGDHGQLDQLIGHEKAIELALGLTGGGKVIEFELDEDDDRYTYKIEIDKDGKEHDIEIDAHTGMVMKYEYEVDD